MIKINITNGNFKIFDCDIKHNASDEQIIQTVNKAFNDLSQQAQNVVRECFDKIIGDYDPKKDTTLKKRQYKRYAYFLNDKRISLKKLQEITGITIAYLPAVIRRCKESPNYRYKGKWKITRKINCSTSNNKE